MCKKKTASSWDERWRSRGMSQGLSNIYENAMYPYSIPDRYKPFDLNTAPNTLEGVSKDLIGIDEPGDPVMTYTPHQTQDNIPIVSWVYKHFNNEEEEVKQSYSIEALDAGFVLNIGCVKIACETSEEVLRLLGMRLTHAKLCHDFYESTGKVIGVQPLYRINKEKNFIEVRRDGHKNGEWVKWRE